MNNVLRSSLIVTLIVALLMGGCVIPAYAEETQEDADTSTSEVATLVDSIYDEGKKEKIIDLLNIEYLEVEITDEKLSQKLNQPNVVYENESVMVDILIFQHRLTQAIINLDNFMI